MQLKINNVLLGNVERVKDLEFILDAKLTFTKNKSYKRLFGFSELGFFIEKYKAFQ